MTTGYTEDLYDGKEVSFPEFAMTCARAFGAFVSMRDGPLDASIPEEFEPSSYHAEQLEWLERRLGAVKSWDKARAEVESEKGYREELQVVEKQAAWKNGLRQRYESMLKQVGAWVPPTPDHKELKQFMIQQLRSSIDFDCITTSKKPIHVSGDEYKQHRIGEIEASITYHLKENHDEVERAKERTTWVRALRKSLRPFEKEQGR